MSGPNHLPGEGGNSPGALGDFFKVTQLISEELRLVSMPSEFVFPAFFPAFGMELNKIWEIVIQLKSKFFAMAH